MSRALFFSVARACTDGKNPAVSGEKKKKGVAVLDSLSLSYVVRCNPLFFLCNALYIPPFLPVKKGRGAEKEPILRKICFRFDSVQAFLPATALRR